MNDQFAGVHRGHDAPPMDVAPVSFPGGADFVPPWPTRKVSIGGAGTLHVLTQAGQDRTIPSGALAPQVAYDLRVVKVFADSTASGILLWE